MTDDVDSPELVNRDGEPIRKGRISPALRTAIVLIVTEGLTVADAAIRTGYKPHSLTQALKKPHVKAFRASVKSAHLRSETDAAYAELCKMARFAASEDVRLKAIKVLIDIDQQASAAMPERANQTIQIIAQHVNLPANLGNNQMAGVIEAQPFQLPSANPSNSHPVGRPDFEADDDE